MFPAPALEQVLRPRIERWARAGLVIVPEGIAARRATTTLLQIRSCCSPCVMWAVARTWLNSWCTARRFQERGTRGCLLSTDCKGEDSIEHCLRCEVVRAVARKKLRLITCKDHPCDLLLLNGGYSDEKHVAKAAALLYAVYVTTNAARHQTGRASIANGEQHVWNTIRKAGLQSRKLAAILAQIWVPDLDGQHNRPSASTSTAAATRHRAGSAAARASAASSAASFTRGSDLVTGGAWRD